MKRFSLFSMMCLEGRSKCKSRKEKTSHLRLTFNAWLLAVLCNALPDRTDPNWYHHTFVYVSIVVGMNGRLSFYCFTQNSSFVSVIPKRVDRF